MPHLPSATRSETLVETTLIVRVPEAEAWVKHLRARFDPSAALDVPAHITIEAQGEIRAVLAKRGPIRGRCHEVELLENSLVRWRRMNVIGLATSSG